MHSSPYASTIPRTSLISQCYRTTSRSIDTNSARKLDSNTIPIQTTALSPA